MSNYFVETGDLDQLTRKNALAIVIVGGKKVNDWFGIYMGGGIEIERSENLGIIKGGVEFFKELDGGWEAKIPLYFDYKFEYTAFGFGLGVSKRF